MNGHSVRAQYTKNPLRVWLARSNEAGFIEHARVWEMENVRVGMQGGGSVKLSDCENVDVPEEVEQ